MGLQLNVFYFQSSRITNCLTSHADQIIESFWTLFLFGSCRYHLIKKKKISLNKSDKYIYIMILFKNNKEVSNTSSLNT